MSESAPTHTHNRGTDMTGVGTLTAEHTASLRILNILRPLTLIHHCSMTTTAPSTLSGPLKGRFCLHHCQLKNTYSRVCCSRLPLSSSLAQAPVHVEVAIVYHYVTFLSTVTMAIYSLQKKKIDLKLVNNYY